MHRRILTIAMLTTLTLGISRAQESVQDLEAALAKNPNDIKTLYKLGTIYYYQAAAGKEDAVEKGMSCFDKAVRLDSSDAVARAYRGSLWTMRGRDASSMEDVDGGIAEMDKAAEMAPDNITVRLIRGINSANLPSPFNRIGVAIGDFDYLLALPVFPNLGAELQSTIYCWAGVAYHSDNKRDKAKDLLRKAIAAAPNSAGGQRAQQELSEMK